MLRDGIIEQIQFMKEKAPPGDVIEDQSEIFFSLSIYIEDFGEEVTSYDIWWFKLQSIPSALSSKP